MPLAVATVLVVGPVLGLLMGLVIEYFDVQPFIVTLAGMFLARGLCYVISVDTLPIKDPTLREVGLNYVSCSPFRVQLRNKGIDPRTLAVDPWTCAQVLPSAEDRR